MFGREHDAGVRRDSGPQERDRWRRGEGGMAGRVLVGGAGGDSNARRHGDGGGGRAVGAGLRSGR